MSLNAPLTTWTDYALAAVSLAFAAATGRSVGRHNQVSASFWCGAFVAAAIAATAGGTFHGFEVRLEPATREVLWNVVLFALGASAALMAAGILGLYFFFRCARTVRDRPGAARSRVSGRSRAGFGGDTPAEAGSHHSDMSYA